MPRRPRSIDVTQVTQWQDGVAKRAEDYLAGEEPLEIRPGRRSLGVMLRTPQMTDFPAWAQLRETSRDFLTPWEPTWPADDLTRSAFRRRGH